MRTLPKYRKKIFLMERFLEAVEYYSGCYGHIEGVKTGGQISVGPHGQDGVTLLLHFPMQTTPLVP